MVKHCGNKPRWYVDYGKTMYYGIYVTIVRGFYHVTNHHGRNTIVNLVL